LGKTEGFSAQKAHDFEKRLINSKRH